MTVINPEVDRLARARHVALATSDGRSTAVRITAEDGYLLVVVPGRGGIADRVRQDPVVTIGPSDYRGRLQGDPVTARATVLDQAALVDRARSLVEREYGLRARLGQQVSRLARRPAPVVLAIELPGEQPD